MLGSLWLAAACGHDSAQAGAAPEPGLTGAPSAAPAAPAAPGARPVAWSVDPPERAMEVAGAAGTLLVVDVWARWCEPCLALRHDVLDRPELGAREARFSFVAVDADRLESAAFVERYGVSSLPTVLVIEPRSGAVRAMRSGTFSLRELDDLLDTAGAPEAGPPAGVAVLRQAHAARVARDPARALGLYEEAARSLQGGARVEAVLGALDLVQELGPGARCVELVAREAALPTATASSGLAKELAAAWARCGEGLAPAAAKRALSDARAFLAARVAAPPPDASLFEKAELCSLSAQLAAGEGDAAGARRAQEDRLALLERAAAAAGADAPSYDHARVKALLALERPDDALALLTRRAADEPRSYEAQGRLGTLLLEDLGRPHDALAPLTRASELAAGVPRLVYLGRLTRALERDGQREQALKNAREELRGWGALPASLRDDTRRLEAEARLAALERGAPRR